MYIGRVSGIGLSFGKQGIITKAAKKAKKNIKRKEIPFEPQDSKIKIDLSPERWKPLDEKLELIDKEMARALRRNDVFNFTP